MLGIKKYYGLRGDPLSLAISIIAGLDFLYECCHSQLDRLTLMWWAGSLATIRV